ncbi:hypothetical protein [Fluviispira multicolorata]|uniref:Uncharacterized protein n=1 Tax=Fluviispira multicolorata TaxID=2654512 RepID=A0A833JBY0_9BACT|nr:hypothetical protein [Fluviispira multicolorata]KAB8029878.1 hypothetical protein GCL57_10090 [Fluviispira multicolorata]
MDTASTQKISSKEKYLEQAVQALKKGLRMCGNITQLGIRSGITRQTLTSIARGRACSHATRLKLEAFIEEQEQRKGKPFKLNLLQNTKC